MSSLEKEITRGFQLLSAYYTGKVGKSGYQEIYATITENEWKSDSFAEKADEMKALLFDSDYFSILKSWLLRIHPKTEVETYKYHFQYMLSEFSTIAFYVGLIKHYEALGGPPNTSSTKGAIFAKNAYSVIDELLFQVLDGKWGGAGDSKAEQIIEKLAKTGQNTYNTTVSREDWEKIWLGMLGGAVVEQRDNKGNFIPLLDSKGKATGKYQMTGDITDVKSELNEGIHPNTEKKVAEWKLKSNGNPANQTFSKATQIIMLHYYATTMCEAPREENKIYKNYQWDHIIPQAAFKKKDSKYQKFCNNIANCQALPSHANQNKSDEKMENALLLSDSNINKSTQKWIKKYSAIDSSDYPKYSAPGNAEQLVRDRGKRMMNEFLDARDVILGK